MLDFTLLLCVAWILNKTICSRNRVTTCTKFVSRAWTLFGLPSPALLTLQFNDGGWLFIAEDSVKLFRNSFTWNIKKLVKDTAVFSSLARNAERFAYQLLSVGVSVSPKETQKCFRSGVKHWNVGTRQSCPDTQTSWKQHVSGHSGMYFSSSTSRLHQQQRGLCG